MGLLNKLKNTFFEEEYVEVEEPTKEEKKKEKLAKKLDVKEIKKAKKIREKEDFEDFENEENDDLIEEPVEFVTEPKEEIVEEKHEEFFSDRDLVNRNKKIAEFDDEDFEPTVKMPVVVDKPAASEKKIYGESAYSLHNAIRLDDMDKYNSTSHRAYGATDNPFKSTPIISPVYGILDKNYRKEEVIDKKEKDIILDANLDSVRNKAYGSISSDKVLYTKADRLIEEVDKVLAQSPEEEIVEEEYVPEIDAKPVVGDVTVGDAEEYFDDLGLEYNVDYTDANYEKAIGRRSDLHHDEEEQEDEEIVENSLEEVILDQPEDVTDEVENEDAVEDEDITLEELINRKNKKEKEEDVEDTANLEDNLFDLVDSMYGEGEE